MQLAQSIDIKTVPLFARRLIEANAGTGKTYTIVTLYLRLILGLAGDNNFSRALLPTEILVVTFTKAATSELTTRIRQRLQQALSLAEGQTSDDPLLNQLLKADQATLNLYQERLIIALRLFDQAAIYTIHSFCQRMLTRYAFLSGLPFKIQLMSRHDELLLTLVEDYWRRHFYPLKAHYQQLIARYWPEGPNALAKVLKYFYQADINDQLVYQQLLVSLKASVNAIVEPLAVPLTALAQAAQRVRENFNIGQLQYFFNETTLAKFNKKQFNAEKLAGYLEALQNWCLNSSCFLSDSLFPASTKPLKAPVFSESQLKAYLRKGQTLPILPLFQALDELFLLQQQLPNIEPLLLRHALAELTQQLAQDKLNQGILTFHDLLLLLDQALRSAHGAELASQIRQSLPAALIDEFQDTDARQYAIFDHIYPLTADPLQQVLFLIGDPKQAIYSFRNADMRTYLLARESVQSSYLLERNYRSSKNMVAAINALFALSKKAFSRQNLLYQPSSAQGLATELIDQGQPITALTFWCPATAELVDKKSYLQTMSEAVCADLLQLLNPSADNTGFIDGNGCFSAIKAADIAILVRTHEEANIISRALQQHNIASVYLSQQTSVFNTQAAYWLWLLLQALLFGSQEHYLKTVLVTQLLSDDLQQTTQWFESARYWQQINEQFAQYRQLLTQQGLLAMVYRLIDDFAVATRLLKLTNGERLLADFLHVCELTQQASKQLEGNNALLRWLEQQMKNELTDQFTDDNAIQRLASDEQLVKIITIHKAKGLEFAIVYLPFICASTNSLISQSSRTHFVSYIDNQQRAIVLDQDEQLLSIAQTDIAQETLRLFYVALTRARFACRLGIAPLSTSKKSTTETSLNNSGFGQLINEGKAVTLEQYQHFLEKIGQSTNMQVIVAPHTEQTLPVISPISRLAACEFTGKIIQDWWVSSYSAIVINAVNKIESANFSDELSTPQILDYEVSTENENDAIAAEVLALPFFPRGMRPGTFLHHLLEQVDFTRIIDPTYRQELFTLIEQQLQLTPYRLEWTAILHQWLIDLSQTKINVEQEFCLQEIDFWQSEVEFWLPISGVTTDQLDILIRQYEKLANFEDYPTLQIRQLSGMLRGFIDLVVCYKQRWYLIDWKSNFLGEHRQDYGADNLSKAMVNHRYDVQYSLYSLAWHRLLRSRLADYSYHQHFGGVIYWFVRGVNHNQQANGVFYRKPAFELIIQLDQLFSNTRKLVHES